MILILRLYQGSLSNAYRRNTPQPWYTGSYIEVVNLTKCCYTARNAYLWPLLLVSWSNPYQACETDNSQSIPDAHLWRSADSAQISLVVERAVHTLPIIGPPSPNSHHFGYGSKCIYEPTMTITLVFEGSGRQGGY